MRRNPKSGRRAPTRRPQRPSAPGDPLRIGSGPVDLSSLPRSSPNPCWATAPVASARHRRTTQPRYMRGRPKPRAVSSPKLVIPCAFRSAAKTLPRASGASLCNMPILYAPEPTHGPASQQSHRLIRVSPVDGADFRRQAKLWAITYVPPRIHTVTGPLALPALPHPVHAPESQTACFACPHYCLCL